VQLEAPAAEFALDAHAVWTPFTQKEPVEKFRSHALCESHECY
jgi:hypothetical protein